MSSRFLRTATLVAFAAFSTYSYAQDDDSPGRVGRISMTQGQVGIAGEVGEETREGLVNWPVTSRNQITTGRDSRTEIRIGSTAIRLDADSALDVAELDDETLRLHLHYGSASIRVRNPELLRGFELSTPQGIVRLDEPGQIRVDSGRRRDETVVSVFTGLATVEGGGSRLTVRAGKRAEIGADDIRTSLATRDRFDEWSMLRDVRDERSESARYVTSEMTGYEELDQHGDWRDSSDYGPLWSPRHTPVGWAPYRDGRWTYLQPWGWTWVDNAAWGYAPFHYGRWVMVNHRWFWAPGRNITRAVWAPALVGWVGGGNAVVTFGSARMPGQGWYPLSPYDNYHPGYRMRRGHISHVNNHMGGRDSRRKPVTEQMRRVGLTVVPHANFSQRGTVVVPTARKPSGPIASLMVNTATAASPPVPQNLRQRDRANDERRGDQPRRAGFAGIPGGAPTFGISPQRRPGNDRRAPVEQAAPAASAPAAAPAGLVMSQPAPAALPDQQRGEPRVRRGERDTETERERRPRGAESFQMQQAEQAQQAQEQEAAQQRQLRMQQDQQRENLQRESMQRQAVMQMMQQQRHQQALQQQSAMQRQQQQAQQAQQPSRQGFATPPAQAPAQVAPPRQPEQRAERQEPRPQPREERTQRTEPAPREAGAAARRLREDIR